MTIQVPYRGIIEIVADHDVGKTIAALQTNNLMKKVVFVDDDTKGEGTVRQMHESGIEFDMYIDLAKRRAEQGPVPTPDQLLLEVVRPTVDEITARHHEVIIWDTWRTVYAACRGHVERNKAQYQKAIDFSKGTSAMIQGLISKGGRMIEQSLLTKLKDACDLLVITHHIKDNYVNNVQVGKIPESSATFSEVCNMRLWLRRNPKSKVPIILFLKRPNIPKMSKGKLTFVNVVPLKITPTDEHESIWDAIRVYEEKPIQNRTPRPDETPTPEEYAAISGTLTQEQQEYVKMVMAYNDKLATELAEAASEEQGDNSSESSQDKPGRKIVPPPEGYPANGVQMLARGIAELRLSKDGIEDILDMNFDEINKTYHPDYWTTLVREASVRATKKGKK